MSTPANPVSASGSGSCFEVRPMNQGKNCVFCDLPAERIVAETPLTLTIRDGYPVSPGHTLVITR